MRASCTAALAKAAVAGVRTSVWIGTLLWFVLAASSPALAQVTAAVRADVDQQSITLDDELTLTITAEGNYDDVQLPALSDWRVTGTFETTQLNIMNGRRSAQRKITRTLEPTRAGTLTIPSARLISAGQVVAQSQPLQIAVAQPQAVAPQSPKEAADLRNHARDSVFVHTSVSTESPYVGEPFVLTYELWVRMNVSVTDRGFGNTPNYDAFSVTNLQEGNQLEQTRKRLGGNVFNVVTLQQNLLVPLHEGKQTIGSVERQLLTGDFFNRRRFTAKSPPLEIQIRPLPTEGQPPSYRAGQIGQFEMKAELDRTEVQAGERAVVTVTISGRGNLAAIKAPEFPKLAGVSAELLPNRDQPSIVTDATGMHGEVSFAYIVVPSQAGNVEIPPLELGIFDSTARAYQVVRSAPLRMVVTGGSALNADGGSGDQALRPFLAEMSLSTDSRSDRGPGVAYWFALALPLLVFGGAEVRARVTSHRARNVAHYRSRDARTKAVKSLDAVRGKAPAEALAGLASALDGFLHDRFGLPAGATRDAMASKLSAAGALESDIRQLVELLDTCDFARFAPSSVSERDANDTLERARSIIEGLDRAAASAGSPRSAAPNQGGAA